MSAATEAPIFRTPEEVAPELGLKPGTLRRLCRETGLCTRLERKRIALTQRDIEQIIEHISNKPADDWAAEKEVNPFV